MKGKKEFSASGKNVLIWGLGIAGGGMGAAIFFMRRHAKEVVVTDIKKEAQLKKEIALLKKTAGQEGVPLRFVLGGHQSSLFKKADIIVQNPAIPRTSPYWKYIDKKKVISDISIFFEEFPGMIIGVTGTKGKSTTATLVHLMLTAAEKKNILAGNIGVSVLNCLSHASPDTIAVLELSSFGLETLPYCRRSPHIAVITNIFEDHLNRYANFSDYINAKKMIARYQKKGDILIINHDDPVIRGGIKKIKSRVLRYSTKKSSNDRNKIFASIHKGSFYVEGKRVCATRSVEGLGKLNQSNVLAAITVAYILGVSIKHISSVLVSFRGLPGRYQYIGSIKGASIINDTCATNPFAAASAIDTASKYFKKIYIIAGGVDKRLPYASFAKSLKRSKARLYLVQGSASDLIVSECAKIGYDSIQRVMSLKEAFSDIIPIIKKRDCLILSPAAASFNMFKNEFDRGAQFIKAYRIYKKKYERTAKKS
jgi:UDP-N-acetylmuramoylalanine--D-glutamate ligase